LSYQNLTQNLFSPFLSKEAQKGAFSYCIFKLFFQLYSQSNFQYPLHQFASPFFSIEFELNSIIELEFASIQFQSQSMYLNSILFKILDPIHLNLNSIQFKVHGISFNIFIQMEHNFHNLIYFSSIHQLIITSEQHKAQMNI
jgi:hypothetical protein